MKLFRPAAALATLLCLTTLTSCSGADDNQKPSAPPGHPPRPPGMAGLPDAPGPAMACPQEAVLQQARTLATFLPGRSDVAAQITTAQITGISGDCQLTKHNKVLVVTFKAGFTASNGPANNEASITVPWFVALTQNNKIISQEFRSVVLNFNGNASMAQAVSPEIKVEVPNVPSSSQLEILVGFDMTPAQRAYAASHPNIAP